MTNEPINTPRPTRMRAALRQAIQLRIIEGKTVVAACYEAGMSPQGYHKAMKRPEVQEYYQDVQIKFVESIESDKPINLVRAYQAGIDLLMNSKSDAVRARMVEFFLAEKKASAVVINNNVSPKGYEYARPGQRVVDIVVADDVGAISLNDKLN